jgi:hypothetical protein
MKITPTTRADRLSLMSNMLALGHSVREIAKATGWKPSTIMSARAESRRLSAEAHQPSLPTVSALNSDLELTNADYRAGRQAMREAGL